MKSALRLPIGAFHNLLFINLCEPCHPLKQVVHFQHVSYNHDYFRPFSRIPSIYRVFPILRLKLYPPSNHSEGLPFSCSYRTNPSLKSSTTYLSPVLEHIYPFLFGCGFCHCVYALSSQILEKKEPPLTTPVYVLSCSRHLNRCFKNEVHLDLKQTI